MPRLPCEMCRLLSNRGWHIDNKSNPVSFLLLYLAYDITRRSYAKIGDFNFPRMYLISKFAFFFMQF